MWRHVLLEYSVPVRRNPTWANIITDGFLVMTIVIWINQYYDVVNSSNPQSEKNVEKSKCQRHYFIYGRISTNSQIHFVLFLISPVADILSHFLFYDIQQIKQAAVATTRRFSDCHTYKRNK